MTFCHNISINHQIDWKADRAQPEYRKSEAPNWERNTNFYAKKKIKIGFVGAGNYSEFHLESLKSIEGVEIDSILSKTGKNSSKLLTKFDIKRSFTEINKFMERKVDAYFIVSSSDSLFDNAKKLFSETNITSINTYRL